jgi:electron transport complex protein RnfG
MRALTALRREDLAALRAVVGVGALCGLLIAVAYEWTRPLIARNRAAALQRAIAQVLPGTSASRAFTLGPDEVFAPLEPGAAAAAGARVVHAGYDAAGRFVGVAIPGEGPGYQDVIRLLWGYSPAQQAVVGLYVLESRETPGLGDRIAFDPVFLRNFERLDEATGALRHAVVAVRSGGGGGGARAPWQIDVITGATVSSRAVARIVGEGAAYHAPRVTRRRADFGGGGEP